MTDDDKRQESGGALPVSLIMVLWSAWLFYWFHVFLGDDLQANSDLFGHIAMVERLGATWWSNPIVFYDRAWFTGWPAFQFYGFVAHLMAWLVSVPLGFFLSDPVRCAIYLVCVVQLATLHWSFLYAARPLYYEVARCSADARSSECLFALVVCALTFWFLNHDGASAGVGASAILGAGLYSQLLGWHLLLIYIGALFRVCSETGLSTNQSRNRARRFSVLLAIMVCTHTLTTFYALFIGMLAFLRFGEWRRSLLRIHLLGIGLSAFWLFPMMALNSDFGVNHTEPPVSSFVGTIFRYPWTDVIRFFSNIFKGTLPMVSVIELMLPLLFLFFFASRKLGEYRLLSNFSVFILIGLVIFNAPFTAAALPLGIHYYRLDSYAVLMLIPVLSVIPFSLMPNRSAQPVQHRIVVSSLVLGVLLVILSVALLPSAELGFVNAANRQKVFADQRDVLNYFKERKGVGRVLFDYFIDSKKFSPGTPHYISANLFKESGVETINGLFIQSSVAYQFPIAMAVALGLTHFTAPLPFADLDTVGVADAIQRLLTFGVTHIVTTDGPHIQALLPFVKGELIPFGPYVILLLKNSKASSVTTVQVPVVGYIDKSGSLPFRLIEYFFFEQAELWSQFDVIELPNEGDIPTQVSLLIFNGPVDDAESIARRHPNLEVLAMNFDPSYVLEHYKVRYNFHRGTEAYAAARPYLQHVLKSTLKRSFDKVLSREHQFDLGKEPRLRWSGANQEFDLEGLEAGRMVRIDYSYFPFWGSPDGTLFRGGAERMIFLPKGPSAHFVYSRWRITPSWWGMGISIMCVVALFLRKFF
jgi:hypothetical protein